MQNLQLNTSIIFTHAIYVMPTKIYEVFNFAEAGKTGITLIRFGKTNAAGIFQCHTDSKYSLNAIDKERTKKGYRNIHAKQHRVSNLADLIDILRNSYLRGGPDMERLSRELHDTKGISQTILGVTEAAIRDLTPARVATFLTQSPFDKDSYAAYLSGAQQTAAAAVAATKVLTPQELEEEEAILKRNPHYGMF